MNTVGTETKLDVKAIKKAVKLLKENNSDDCAFSVEVEATEKFDFLPCGYKYCRIDCYGCPFGYLKVRRWKNEDRSI